MDVPYEEKILELHDIALLLNYERAATEPRFRHAKLREVATPGSDFKTVLCMSPIWTEATIPRTGFVFDRKRPTREQEDEPDLPSNMLPTPVPPSLRNLTPKDLETYYWQARNHDGCFRTVTLFQHFIDLFPEFTRVRVRTVEGKDKTRVYTALADDRTIVEMNLFDSKALSASMVMPDNKTYITGSDPQSLHAVLGFASPGGKLDTILDLSSLQFGDVGRGDKGRSLYVLEPINQYLSRLDKYAEGNDFPDAKLSSRINDAPDSEWLRKVAKKAKERWDNRKTTPWCGHCGAPPRSEGLKRCAQCKGPSYCNSEHQKAAWTYHKHFCRTPEKKD